MTAKPKPGLFRAAITGEKATDEPLLEPTKVETPVASLKNPRASTRQDKRGFTVWIEPEALRSLKHIAADTDKTMQDIGIEALNDFLAKHGKNRIA